MPTSVELIRKYGAEQLDEVFVKESASAVLEADQSLLKFVGAKTVMIPDYTMDGLGDYSRSTGFPDGDVTLEWTPYQLSMDRGRSFSIDSQTDEESAGLAFGKLAVEFMRTKVIPEVDAYRFSKLLANAAEGNVIQSETITATNVISKFNDDDQKFDDNEINHAECVRFVSNSIMTAIKSSSELAKHITQADYSSAAGLKFSLKMYDDVALIPVPKNRFWSAYDFGAKGFAKKSDAVEINYLTVHRNAALCIKKHEKVRVFSPDVNQKKDAWSFQYRLYHDIFTPKMKQIGITASVKGTYTTPGRDGDTSETALTNIAANEKVSA